MDCHNCQESNSLRGLVVRLANEIDYKNHLLMEKEGLTLEKFATMSSLIEEKDRLLGERSEVIGSLMAQKHRLHESFVEELRKCDIMKQDMKIIRDNLQVQQQKLDAKSKEPEELRALNDKGRGAVTNNNTINSNGCLESRELDLKVPVNQSCDIFEMHDDLQNSLEKLQHLRAQNDDLKAQFESLRKELNQKGEALHKLESLNQTLISNEFSSTEELKAARMEAIQQYFQTMDGNGAKVGIKRVGEIDPRTFRDVCSRKICSGNWEEKFNEIHFLWQENVTDPSWNPFRRDTKNGELSIREVVDENDKKLVALRQEWGEGAYKAIVNALLELKKYNPITRSFIPELWNFEEGRRAYLKEVLQCIIQQWEVLRKKDREQSGAVNELRAEKEGLLEKLASINVLMEEKDKLLKEKFATVGKLTVQNVEKDSLLGKMSATIRTLTAEKQVILENSDAGKRTLQFMKEEIEKLKQELQSQVELAKNTEKHKQIKRHRCGGEASITIKEESMDWHLDSLNFQVGPIGKDSKVHNTKEKISSTSKGTKVLSDGSLDALQVSQSTAPKAVISPLSQCSMVLEKIFEIADVKKEE